MIIQFARLILSDIYKGAVKMRVKKVVCMFFACMLIIGMAEVPVKVVETEHTGLENLTVNFISTRATGSFNMSIPAKSRAVASSSFPLAAGETVTIKASYSPFSASVDVGLIAPDGTYYYFNITSGSIDKTIQVDEGGKYTLQIRNNSSSEIQVSGFVNY